MERAYLAEITIEELERRIRICEREKQKLILFLQNLKNKWLKHEITYFEYEELTDRKIKGKTPENWFEFYDIYMKICVFRELPIYL